MILHMTERICVDDNDDGNGMVINASQVYNNQHYYLIISEVLVNRVVAVFYLICFSTYFGYHFDIFLLNGEVICFFPSLVSISNGIWGEQFLYKKMSSA